MFTFSKKFQPKTFFRIKETYFSKRSFKINYFEKYSAKTIFCAIGGSHFPRKMFLFFKKLTNHSIFTILF